MTVKELKDFIKDYNDDELVKLCCCRDDNPIGDEYDVGMAYHIECSKDTNKYICLMPM